MSAPSDELFEHITKCGDVSDCIEVSAEFGFYLKPISKLSITVTLPKLKSGQSISNNEIIEKLSAAIFPQKFLYIKAIESALTSLKFIRLEAEVKSEKSLKYVISKLDRKGIKLSGLSVLLKIHVTKSKLTPLNREDWDSFFRESKHMNETKSGERPDTVCVQAMPCKWFADLMLNPFLPNIRILDRVFENYGHIRISDVPILDPYRKQMSPAINGFKPGSFTFRNERCIFDCYVQFRDYISFAKCMTDFHGKKLVLHRGEECWQANVKIDFDKAKHMSESTIKKRDNERENLMAIEREKNEKMKMALGFGGQMVPGIMPGAPMALPPTPIIPNAAAVSGPKFIPIASKVDLIDAKEKHEKKKEKELRRRQRESKRRMKKIQNKDSEKIMDMDDKISKKIAMEERKLLIAQRKLESIRLLDTLFGRIKINHKKEVLTMRAMENSKKDENSSSELVVKEKKLREKLVNSLKMQQQQAMAHSQKKVEKAIQGNLKSEDQSSSDSDEDISSLSSSEEGYIDSSSTCSDTEIKKIAPLAPPPLPTIPNQMMNNMNCQPGFFPPAGPPIGPAPGFFPPVPGNNGFYPMNNCPPYGGPMQQQQQPYFCPQGGPPGPMYNMRGPTPFAGRGGIRDPTQSGGNMNCGTTPLSKVKPVVKKEKAIGKVPSVWYQRDKAYENRERVTKDDEAEASSDSSSRSSRSRSSSSSRSPSRSRSRRRKSERKYSRTESRSKSRKHTSRRTKSRSRGADEESRSRSRSVRRDSKSRSKSVERDRKSRSKSAKRDNKSRSKSTKRDSKSRSKSVERDSKSRSKSVERDSKSRSKSAERDSKSRSRSAERNGKSKSAARERSSSKPREKSKSVAREGSRSKSRQSRSKSRDSSRSKSRSSSSSRSRSKSRHGTRSKSDRRSRSKSHRRSRSKSRRRSSSRSSSSSSSSSRSRSKSRGRSRKSKKYRRTKDLKKTEKLEEIPNNYEKKVFYDNFNNGPMQFNPNFQNFNPNYRNFNPNFNNFRGRGNFNNFQNNNFRGRGMHNNNNNYNNNYNNNNNFNNNYHGRGGFNNNRGYHNNFRNNDKLVIIDDMLQEPDVVLGDEEFEETYQKYFSSANKKEDKKRSWNKKEDSGSDEGSSIKNRRRRSQDNSSDDDKKSSKKKSKGESGDQTYQSKEQQDRYEIMAKISRAASQTEQSTSSSRKSKPKKEKEIKHSEDEDSDRHTENYNYVNKRGSFNGRRPYNNNRGFNNNRGNYNNNYGMKHKEWNTRYTQSRTSFREYSLKGSPPDMRKPKERSLSPPTIFPSKSHRRSKYSRERSYSRSDSESEFYDRRSSLGQQSYHKPELSYREEEDRIRALADKKRSHEKQKTRSWQRQIRPRMVDSEEEHAYGGRPSKRRSVYDSPVRDDSD